MDNKPLLSICIPTYNHAPFLDLVLKRLRDICVKNRIHIYISDNNSEDNTEAVVESAKLSNGFIHYYRQNVNIGPDDNFEFVLKMSDTKYRWLMSDACYVDEMDGLIEDLSTSDYDGYILGAPYYRGRFLPNRRIEYCNSIDLMRDVGWHLSWISCMIYNERLIQKMDFRRYKNSSFNQTALMFDPTAYNKSTFVFNNRIIVKNITLQDYPIMKESGWTYHVFDVMYRQWYLLIMSLPLYYPYETKIKCINESYKYSSAIGVFAHIRRRVENKWNLNDVLRNRVFITRHFYILLVIAICPKFLLRLIVRLGEYVKQILR